MNNLNIKFDVNELGEYGKDFDPTEIINTLSEQIMFKDIEKIREDFKFEKIKLNDYKDPYRVEFKNIEIDENKDTILNLKVKDQNGRTCPRLVPYGEGWFVCGNGPKIDIDICDSLESISNVFSNKYSGEYDFAYMCVIDENLEVVDWNSFYDFYENQDCIKEFKEKIIKKFPDFVNQEKIK